MVSVKITISKAQVKAKVDSAWKAGLFVLSNEILADCNQYVKRSPDRTMLKSSLIQSRPQDGVLVWDTPYAKRQYWEIQTALTPGTTWRWIETAKRKHLKQWQALAQKGVKDNL